MTRRAPEDRIPPPPPVPLAVAGSVFDSSSSKSAPVPNPVSDGGRGHVVTTTSPKSEFRWRSSEKKGESLGGRWTILSVTACREASPWLFGPLKLFAEDETFGAPEIPTHAVLSRLSCNLRQGRRFYRRLGAQAGVYAVRAIPAAWPRLHPTWLAASVLGSPSGG